MRIAPPRGTLTVPKPAGLRRVETGPVQFGEDDWPGVFIRGDNALQYANVVQAAAQLLKEQGADQLTLMQLDGIISDLMSCSVGNTGWPPVEAPEMCWHTDVTPSAEDWDAARAAAMRAVEAFKRTPRSEPGSGATIALMITETAIEIARARAGKKAPGEPGAAG